MCLAARHRRPTNELGNNADVSRGKAAMLAVQELYRKVFLRGKARPSTRRNRTTANFLDRFQLDLGALDNKDRRATDHEAARRTKPAFTSSANPLATKVHRTAEIPHSFPLIIVKHRLRT